MPWVSPCIVDNSDTPISRRNRDSRQASCDHKRTNVNGPTTLVDGHEVANVTCTRCDKTFDTRIDA